ncbi:hypothetical protein TNCV_4444401 [Trichonephila clavipes]|nr:hypothetical protein TNCV_4444401 [Trichonephila clavipes]
MIRVIPSSSEHSTFQIRKEYFSSFKILKLPLERARAKYSNPLKSASHLLLKWKSPNYLVLGFAITIVRVQCFVRGGFVGYRSRASSKHLSPHLPVGSLDSSGGSNRGCAASEAARVGVESTKKPTPDVVVVFET